MSEHRDTVYEVFRNVLEQQAFMFTSFADEMAPPADGLRGSIAFEGPSPGRLEVWTDLGFARDLAANVLGDDAAPDDAALDALGELLNVAAGQIVAGIVGADVAVPLQSPVVEPCATAPWPEDDDAISLEVDEHQMMVRFRLA